MDMAATDWRIWTPVISALGGVVVGSLIKLVYDEIQWRRQRSQRRDDQKRIEDDRDRVRAHAALEVALALEDYALDCADVLSDNIADQYDQSFPVREMKPWPEAIDWRALEPQKLDRIRQLTVRSRIVRLRAINAVSEEGHIPGEAPGIWAEAAGEIGLDAWRTAEQVRTDHGLPPFTFSEGQWNFPETMQAHIDRMTKIRKDYAAMAGNLPF
ncbi:hypothetical protein [Brevundimonas sp.]|uniref:hypothetical protein n=1 Tax=Brevundimonas sp. TaxID=1871086 RepID=UPI0025C075AF|nr:hypothetical protein [Brevundimonas sp.]MCG2663366.1 hypothetical protein [Brevundimonas sp.]